MSYIASPVCIASRQWHAYATRLSYQFCLVITSHKCGIDFCLLAKIQIVDQTAELENFYSTDDIELSAERPTPGTRSSDSVEPPVSVPNPKLRETVSLSPIQHSTIRSEPSLRSSANFSPVTFDNILSFSGTKRRRTDDSSTPSEYQNVQLQPISQVLPGYNTVRDSVTLSTFTPNPNSYGSPTELNETRRIEQEYARIADHQAAQIPDQPFLSVASWKKNFRWPNQYTTQQCRVLFKYYIDVLGPWVSKFGLNWRRY